MYLLNRRGFEGIGPKIDTNLEEARRLAAIDLKTKKNREVIEMVNKQIDSCKSKNKDSDKKTGFKLALDINNSNWNMSVRQSNLKNDNSMKHANLTPRINTFDFSVYNVSDTTEFQTPLTCKKSQLK